MKRVVWLLVVLLIVFHQDFWNWAPQTPEENMVFGFWPVGLAYHIGISLAAAFVWFLATIFAWPEDEFADAKSLNVGGEK